MLKTILFFIVIFVASCYAVEDTLAQILFLFACLCFVTGWFLKQIIRRV
jgi:hypothetical protein